MAKSKQAKVPKTKPGPAPETLKLEGNWEDAMKTALAKKKPKGGWPKK